MYQCLHVVGEMLWAKILKSVTVLTVVAGSSKSSSSYVAVLATSAVALCSYADCVCTWPL
jgi:hypothetical protein